MGAHVVFRHTCVYNIVVLFGKKTLCNKHKADVEPLAAMDPFSSGLATVSLGITFGAAPGSLGSATVIPASAARGRIEAKDSLAIPSGKR